MIKQQQEFKVRVVYKSGYAQDFWCCKFAIHNGSYSWTSADPRDVTPMLLGVDEVTAVWQIGTRRRFVWSR